MDAHEAINAPTAIVAASGGIALLILWNQGILRLRCSEVVLPIQYGNARARDDSIGILRAESDGFLLFGRLGDEGYCARIAGMPAWLLVTAP